MSRRSLARSLAGAAVALALLGARRIRFVAEFALLAGPLVAVATTRLAAAGARRRSDATAARALTSAAVGASLLVATLAPRLDAARRGDPVLDLGVEADLVPTAAVAFTEENGLRDRMYNDLEVGSYLTWEGWPRHRVFQDPRINGYPASMHAVLRRADLTRAEWQAFLDGFGVTSALLSYPSLNPRATLFDPGRWALVYRAADGLVFARRDGARAALIAARELPLTFGRAADGTIVEQVLEARPPTSEVADCEWSARVAEAFVERGDDARARPLYERALEASDASEGACAGPARQRALRVALGDLDLRRGDPAAAIRAYADVPDAEVRLKRGLALLALGRAAEALDDLAAARRARPDEAEPALGEGLALAALGRRAEARAALEAFLRLHPAHVAAGRARAELAKLR